MKEIASGMGNIMRKTVMWLHLEIAAYMCELMKSCKMWHNYFKAEASILKKIFKSFFLFNVEDEKSANSGPVK